MAKIQQALLDWRVGALVAFAAATAVAVPANTISFATDFPAKGVQSGQATFYDSDGTGHCSLGASSNGIFGAMATPLWASAAVCGACVLIKHASNQVMVPIVDECPGCSAGSIDLSRGAFGKLAPEGAGRIPISWQVVPCPVSGSLQYRFKPDANAQYLAVQVSNYALPVRAVECRASGGGGSWQTLNRSPDNYFIGSTPSGGKLDFRISTFTGTAVEDTGITFSPGQTVTGRQNLGSIQVDSQSGQTQVRFNATNPLTGKPGSVSATIGPDGVKVITDQGSRPEEKTMSDDADAGSGQPSGAGHSLSLPGSTSYWLNSIVTVISALSVVGLLQA